MPARPAVIEGEPMPEQSRTAGRSSFITGQSEFLPTVHGFDELSGNLYHLNAEEEPEQPYWPPKDDFPRFSERFSPRGVIHSHATDVDDEVLEKATDFIGRAAGDGTPFFVWFNTTHMHFRTHPKPESVGQAGRCPGTLQVWAEPFVTLRVPKLFNLRMDPFERTDTTSNTYWDRLLTNDFLVLAGTTLVARFLETFKEFPPRQKAASFTIDQALEKMEAAMTAGR